MEKKKFNEDSFVNKKTETETLDMQQEFFIQSIF